MKQTAILTTASLLSILLTMFHLTDHIVFKLSAGGFTNFVVWTSSRLA